MLYFNSIFSPTNFIWYLDVMPARCRGLVACLCVVIGLWEKIYIYGEKLLQFTMFSRKKTTKLNF